MPMIDGTDTDSFDHADLRIRQLLDSLKAKGVCGCCVAHALLFNGVRLYETVGRNDVAKLCEEYAASLHEHSMPVPDRSSQH
jgi:hypothetical protein